MPFFENDENDKRKGSVPYKERKQKCLVCGRMEDYWCRVREDELIGLCRYVPSEDGRQDSRGRYIHKFEGEAKTPVNVQLRIADPVEYTGAEPEADFGEHTYSEYKNLVYHRYLKGLGLSDAHRKGLLERGLSIEKIKANEYATVPSRSDLRERLDGLGKRFQLEHIPGFYQSGEDWRLNGTFPGFYVPYRDVDGNIVGMQVRRDDGEPKYMWVSSAGKPNGTSSGAPLHFVNPNVVREKGELYLTEGALKADAIGASGDVGLIATAGVNVINPKDLSKAIFAAFPDVDDIVVAYDADWRTKETVRSALLRLVGELDVDSAVDVYVAVWDEGLGKGLDDVLKNANYVESDIDYIPAKDFLMSASGVGVDEPPPFPPHVTEEKDEDGSFVYSWDEFLKLRFSNAKQVISGLGRGNVGLMVASTNVGKTTYSLNLALSAASRRTFEPLLNASYSAKRVLYVDGEATKAELQRDIRKMSEVFTEEEGRSLSENLFLVCDEELDGEPLNLVNPEHFERLGNAALDSKADLIIIDTLSALMDLEDENDNAKVKKEVMKPLKELAKRANAAVLLLHHSGKYNEGYAPQGAFKGRGASAFGALARMVINLKADDSGDNRVAVTCSKVKGDKFENHLVQLDESRWFQIIGTSEREEDAKSYRKVLDFVCKAKGQEVKRRAIEESTGVTRSTLTRILKKAVAENDDLKSPRYGWYTCSHTHESNQEMPLGE